MPCQACCIPWTALPRCLSAFLSMGSLPWAFSGGICWQGTACMDFSAMEVSLLLWSKGIQAHWPQKRLETLSVSSSSSWWGTGCSLGADEVFLTFSFPAINFHSGVVVVMNTTFHFLFLLSILGFVLSKESMTWFFRGSDLSRHLCCSAP